MNNSILIIGENSFIAKYVIKDFLATNKYSVTTCSHDNFPGNLDIFDWVMNFSTHPDIYKAKYSRELDQDLIIAKQLTNNIHTKFFFVSSRTVYPTSNEVHYSKEIETPDITNQKQYGLNKLQSERNVINTLGMNRVLIVRASNIFGSEYGRHTFMGIAQKSLIENNRIKLDINSDTVRDFIPVEYFSAAIIRLINLSNTGIYNIGSGIQLSLGEICSAIIKGFGSGEIIDSKEIRDQFVLDIEKLKNAIPYDIAKTDVLKYAESIGETLKEAHNGH